jgi:hypothetical protein
MGASNRTNLAVFGVALFAIEAEMLVGTAAAEYKNEHNFLMVCQHGKILGSYSRAVHFIVFGLACHPEISRTISGDRPPSWVQ